MAIAPPEIAIVGSIDVEDEYDPPLRDPQMALRACEELGRQLAGAGCNLVVYSSDVRFIEPHVVRGYLSVRPLRPRSVHVHYSVSVGAYRFEGDADSGEAFAYHADASEDWEVSFYRSLARVDGIVILGGARSALVAGILAVTYRVPVLAVAGFGAAGRKVWQVMSSAKDVASAAELTEMALDHWEDNSAARLVNTLLVERERLGKEKAAAVKQQRRAQRHGAALSLLSIGLFVAALIGLLAGFAVSGPGSMTSFAVLFSAPALAGASGSTIRIVFAPSDSHRVIALIALGFIAGGIATVLFVVAQLTTNQDLFASDDAGVASYRGLLLFCIAVGFMAGFTFDLVYRRLSHTDILGGDPFPKPIPVVEPTQPPGKTPDE